MTCSTLSPGQLIGTIEDEFDQPDELVLCQAEVPPIEIIESSKGEIFIDENYIPSAPPTTDDCWDIIPSETPTFETISGNSSMDEVLRILYSASRVPSFASLSNLATFLAIREYRKQDAEQVALWLAGLLTINPPLTWWLVCQSSTVASHLIFHLLQFAILNPSKMVIVYSVYRRSGDIRSVLSSLQARSSK